jgi:peptidoglycan/xylan/chitin deacetylase (PgdA/CDA1 family)
VLTLEAGMQVAPGGLSTIAERAASACFLLPEVRFGRGETIRPRAADRETIVASPFLVPAATLFDRAALAEISGLDESLERCDTLDAVLRLLARGHAGDVAGAVVVPHETAWSREDLEPHLRALAAVLERHRATFACDPASVLYEQERRLAALAPRHRAARLERASAVTEIEALRARRDRVTSGMARCTARVRFGDLARTSPVSRDWGYERGRPIDRYYIERFIAACAGDVRGRVLEIQEPDYTTRFGGSRVARSDVLDIDPANPRATVIADLRDAPNLGADSYDCVILTQTVHVIDDMPRVIDECRRILRPDGVLLCTLPCSSRVCLEYGPDGDFWRVTEAGARRLFEPVFGQGAVTARAHGNVLASTAFAYGLACEDVDETDLDVDDPFNPLIVCVRAVKVRSPAPVVRSPRDLSAGKAPRATILMYHRVGVPASDVHHLSVPPHLLKEHLAWIADECTPMALDALAEAARSGMLPDRAVAVTFDDGYEDFLTTAAGLLRASGVPATVFLTTHGLDGHEPFHYWWDILESALLTASPGGRVLEVPLPDGVHAFPMTSYAERRLAHDRLHAALVPVAGEVRDRALAAVRAWCADACSSARRLTTDEIRSLRDTPGIAVGAHTVHHLALPFHTTGMQRGEIFDSRRALEGILGYPPTAFAYPYGAWNIDSAVLVQQAGYSVAVTCEHDVVTSATDRYALPRVEVGAITRERLAVTLDRLFAQELARR